MKKEFFFKAMRSQMLLNVERGGKKETQGLGVGRKKKQKESKEAILPQIKRKCINRTR